MTHSFKLSRRIARLRVPVLGALLIAAGACSDGNQLTSDPSANSPQVTDQGLTLGDNSGVAEDSGAVDTLAISTQAGAPLASSSFAGGIPIGTGSQALSAYGSVYNGGLNNIWPEYLLNSLSAIKSRGGKVILMFAGAQQYYKDASGHFSLDKWKARVDRFRKVNFSSYVSDGTIVGHYLIDEPNDPSNWNGQPVSPQTVEAMAQYSKSIWPNMPTIVRTEPSYFPFSPKYIDAAWAQYLYRRGDVNDYIRRNVNDAQNRGMALVVGLNILRGGNPNGSQMSPSEIENWGSALLSSSYPCMFISWQYGSYAASSSVKSAMSYLRNKAENRSLRSCRGN